MCLPPEDQTTIDKINIGVFGSQEKWTIVLLRNIEISYVYQRKPAFPPQDYRRGSAAGAGFMGFHEFSYCDNGPDLRGPGGQYGLARHVQNFRFR